MKFKGKVAAISRPVKIDENSNFDRILIELLGEDMIMCLSCSIQEYERWKDIMTVETTISVSPITEIVRCRNRLTNNMVTIFILGEPSICEVISDLSLIDQEPSSLVDCVAKVESINERYLEFTLDNELTVNLCHINGPDQHTVPWPSVGQEIKVTDAHSIRNCLCLCGRSRIEFSGAAPTMLNTENMPLISVIKLVGMSYCEKLWLKRQLQSMEQESFSETFLASVGLPRVCHNEWRETILKNIIILSTPQEYCRGQKSSKAFEFIDLSDCTVSQRDIYRCDLPKLKNLIYRYRIQDPKTFWNYGVHRTIRKTEFPKIVLVGYLDIIDGHWVFQDGTETSKCVIVNLKDPEKVYRNFVAIQRYMIIHEVFKLKDNNTKTLMYIQFSRKDFSVIFTIPRIHDATNNLLCHYCKGIGLPEEHICMSSSRQQDNILDTSEGESSIPNKIIRLEERTGTCHSSGLKVTVLQKMSFLLASINGPRFYYVMVSVSKLANESPEAVKCVFLFTNASVSIVPLLTTGKSYRVHNGQKIDLLNIIRTDFLPTNIIPLNKTITIPPDTVFIPLDDALEPACHICSVQDSLEIEDGQVVCFEGILYDRFNLEPKYNSEKKNFGVEGYGIPGQLNLVLKIRDRPQHPPSQPLPSEDHSPKDVSIYFNNRHGYRYPLGMIPGARLRVLHVKKYTSKTDGSPYFISTQLTAIEVLEWEEHFYPDVKRLWGFPSFILTEFERVSETNLVGTVDVSRLLNVSLKLVCSGCDGSMRERDNCCQNRTVIKGSANFVFEKLTQCTTFLVENELIIKLLQLTDQKWNELKSTVERVKELTYNIQGQEDLGTTRMSLSDLVFHHICSTLPKKTINICCRLLLTADHCSVYYVTLIREKKQA